LGQAVNAWQAIATAIDNLTNRGDELDAPQLALTAAGTRLHALTLGFRDVALALIARLKVSERPLLALAQPDLGGWGFGADAVLIRPRFGPQDTGRTDVVLNIQLDELFGSLGKILSNERRSVVEQELWRITLLGWLVTIGVLTSAVDTRFANGADEREARPTLEAVRDQPRLAQDLSGLARQLLTLGRDVTNGERGWPWGLFDSASAMVTQVGTNVLCDLLEQTALKFGPSRRSAVLVTRDEQTSLRIRGEDLAEQKLQAFQYLLCGLVGDQRREPETEVDDNGNVFQVWGGVFSSASMRPLVITRLTEALAKKLSSDRQPQLATPDDKPIIDVPLDKPKALVVDGPSPSPEVEIATSPLATIATNEDPLQKVWACQIDAWRRRGAAPAVAAHAGRHMARIAFLQIDFAETYDDPNPADVVSGVGKIEKLVRATSNGGEVYLCVEEWRRRCVMQRVLEACEAFDVDILVLPEYSMAHETVLWLARFLEEHNSTLSVWAGTFRVPSSLSIAVDLQKFTGVVQHILTPDVTGREMWTRLQARAAVIFRDRIKTAMTASEMSEAGLHANILRSQIVTRQKRYPAIAFTEIFAPAQQANLVPLTEFSRSPWRPESFVFELICSEIFAFNGPMNTNSIVANLARLMVDFGVVATLEEGERRALAQLHSDAKIFSNWASHDFDRRNWPRRSILLAPCITRRDVDYHVLGLTAHLSAGIATIFCNSVVPGYSNGGSCLIGFNGWQSRKTDSAVSGPYHGAVPGVLAPSADMTAPLGDHERALVIVDVDPEQPTQNNPRPQYRGDPACLIAHLPILATATEQDTEAKWFECVKDQSVKAFAEKVASLDFAGKSMTTFSILGQGAMPQQLSLTADATSLCDELAHLAIWSPGLKARAIAFKAMSGSKPVQWPPPAVVDWIAVDLSSERFRDARTAAQQGTIDEDAAPWIWTKPPPRPSPEDDPAPEPATANST
jgi:hypothetical protein